MFCQKVHDLNVIHGYIKEALSAWYSRISHLNHRRRFYKLTANYSTMGEAVVHHHEHGKAIHELLLTHCYMQSGECECRTMPAELDLDLTAELFSLTTY